MEDYTKEIITLKKNNNTILNQKLFKNNLSNLIYNVYILIYIFLFIYLSLNVKKRKYKKK